MNTFRVIMVLEALLLLACGILCVAWPHLVGTASAPPSTADMTATYTRWALGLALGCLAVLLFHVMTDTAKFHELTVTYVLLPAVCLPFLLVVNAIYSFSISSPLRWTAIIGLPILTLILLRIRAVAVVAGAAPSAPSNPQTPGAPSKPQIPSAPSTPQTPIARSANFNEDLALHQARMKFAWDWFHFHADQRLKAFNYFVLIVGILLLAYGTAIKEANAARAVGSPVTTFEFFAGGVAASGFIMSIAFLLIEVRNLELVECGRTWLNYLEGGLGMTLRRDDDKRACLASAVGWATAGITPPEWLIKHKFWIRVIYGLGVIGFMTAFGYAMHGFK